MITMRHTTTLILLTLGLFFYSCERNDSNPVYPYEAIVFGPNNDCGLYEVKFTNDLSGVIEKVGKSVVDSIYIAESLPEDLKIYGLEIKLDIRKPKTSELGICTDRGPSLNWVHVIYAKQK